MLESLGVVTLADPDPGDRNSLHFACSVGSTLYTIRNDKVLCAWSLDDALVPTLRSTAPITSEREFYSPNYQVEAGHLILRYEPHLAIFDIRKPEEPVPVAAMKVDDLEGCVAANGRLHVQLCPRAGSYTYTSTPFPPAKPLVLAEAPPLVDGAGAAMGLAAAGRIYWITQDGIEVRTIEPNAEVGRMRLDNVVGHPIVVGDDRIAVLEIYDDERNGIVFADIAKPKPKRLTALCKKEVVRGFALVGNELHVVVRKGSRAKAVTSLAVVDVATMTETRRERLPFTESDAPGWVYWLGVVGTTAAVLRGSGELHRFRL